MEKCSDPRTKVRVISTKKKSHSIIRKTEGGSSRTRWCTLPSLPSVTTVWPSLGPEPNEKLPPMSETNQRPLTGPVTSDHPAAEIWLIRGWVSRCEDGEMWDVPDCGSRDEMGPALRSEDPASISRPLTQSGNQLNQSSKCDVETQLLIREFKQSALNNRSDQSGEKVPNIVEAAVPLITSLRDSLVSGSQVALLGPQPPERGARHKDTKLHKQKSQLCRDYHGSRPSEGDIMMPREGPKLHNYIGYNPCCRVKLRVRQVNVLKRLPVDFGNHWHGDGI